MKRYLIGLTFAAGVATSSVASAATTLNVSVQGLQSPGQQAQGSATATVTTTSKGGTSASVGGTLTTGGAVSVQGQVSFPLGR